MSGPPQLSVGYLGDFCGEIFKEHPRFSMDASALQVIGYYDGVQIANPLGSGKHNIGKSTSTSFNVYNGHSLDNMHMYTQEQFTSLLQY